MATEVAPLDEDACDDDFEIIDLSKPVRRSVVDRPPRWRSAPNHLSVVELRLAEVHLGADQYDGPVTGFLVGENPGPHAHADLPLFPWPDTSAAGRLLAMSGLTGSEYLSHFYRRNLVDLPRWSRQSAAKRARGLITSLFEQPRDLKVVLCGLKVARAFGVKTHGFWSPFRLTSRQICVIIPHPSGRNRIYKHSDARDRTGWYIRWAAGKEQVT